MCVNWAATSYGFESWNIQWLFGNDNKLSWYRKPFNANIPPAASLLCPKNELQQRVKNVWPGILDVQRAVPRHQSIIELSAACLGRDETEEIMTMPKRWASLQCQWIYELHLWKCWGCGTTFFDICTIRRLSPQPCLRQHLNYVLNITINGALLIFGLASW